jgi:hypothetical protein
MLTLANVDDQEKLIISRKWEAFIKAAKATKKAWEELTKAADSYPIDEAQGLSTFASRCLATFKRRTFEKMFSDFLVYVIQSGGFNTIK